MLTLVMWDDRIVWVDETATYLYMTPSRAWAPRGKRAYYKGRRRAQRYSLIVAMTTRGILTRRLIRGGMKLPDWLAFVREDLLPAMSPTHQFVQMDNLNLHKKEESLSLFYEAKKVPLFQPPYSPESNPIEEAFSKFKQVLRRQGAKTLGELRESIQKGVDSLTPSDFANWIAHARMSVANW